MSLSRSIAVRLVDETSSVTDVVSVLRTYNLLSLLPHIAKEMKHLSSMENRRDTLFIETPFPLTAQSLARIKRIVGNDLAKEEVTINSSLLAGFKARWKGRVYDGGAERIIKQLTIPY